MTIGEDAGLEHSPPQFVKILHDGTVQEGDSVTIDCKSSHEDDHGMKARAPEFTKKLSDEEVGHLILHSHSRNCLSSLIAKSRT